MPPAQAVGGSAAETRRRGIISEDGSSELLLFSLSGCFASGGPTFGRPKVGGKSASPFGLDPRFCPIGRLQGRNPVATEIPRGLRLSRNRCGGSRTSPDGPRAEGCFFFGGGRKQSVFHRRRQLNAEIRFACPFNRATAEVGRAARPRSDARRAWQFSGCAVSALIQTD